MAAPPQHPNRPDAAATDRKTDRDRAVHLRPAVRYRPARHRPDRARRLFGRGGARDRLRSEEHTSELQSLMRISYAVFCLKKKNYTMLTCTQCRAVLFTSY